MNLYHVQYDCGDFYCDGMHTVGIFANNELATAAIDEFKSGGTWKQNKWRNSFQFAIVVRKLDIVDMNMELHSH